MNYTGRKNQKDKGNKSSKKASKKSTGEYLGSNVPKRLVVPKTGDNKAPKVNKRENLLSRGAFDRHMKNRLKNKN